MGIQEENNYEGEELVNMERGEDDTQEDNISDNSNTVGCITSVLYILIIAFIMSFVVNIYYFPYITDNGYKKVNCTVKLDKNTCEVIMKDDIGYNCYYGTYGCPFDSIGNNTCYINPKKINSCDKLSATDYLEFGEWLLSVGEWICLTTAIFIITSIILSSITYGLRMIITGNDAKTRLEGVYVICLLIMMVGLLIGLIPILDITSISKNNRLDEGFSEVDCYVTSDHKENYNIYLPGNVTCSYNYRQNVNNFIHNAFSSVGDKICYYKPDAINVCYTVHSNQYYYNFIKESVKICLWLGISFIVPSVYLSIIWRVFTCKM